MPESSPSYGQVCRQSPCRKHGFALLLFSMKTLHAVIFGADALIRERGTKDKGPEFWSPRTHAHELLSELKIRDVPLAVLCAVDTPTLLSRLDEAGLSSFFTKKDASPEHLMVFGGESAPRRLPAPDLFRHAAAALGFRSQNCISVCAHEPVIAASSMAGCLTIQHRGPSEALNSHLAPLQDIVGVDYNHPSLFSLQKEVMRLLNDGPDQTFIYGGLNPDLPQGPR